MPLEEAAVLGFDSRDGPADSHGEVESCWIRGRATSLLGEAEVACRVHLSEEARGR